MVDFVSFTSVLTGSMGIFLYSCDKGNSSMMVGKVVQQEAVFIKKKKKKYCLKPSRGYYFSLFPDTGSMGAFSFQIVLFRIIGYTSCSKSERSGCSFKTITCFFVTAVQ